MDVTRRFSLTNVTVSSLAPFIGLLVMALAFALQLLVARLPDPRPESAPAAEFSAGRALAIAERLLGDGAPHPVGSAANEAVRDHIIAELEALGLPVELRSTFACSSIWPLCGYVENILTRLPGQSEGPAVMLTAHYDSVPAGPGAADDIAGVATILEIARILSAEPPPRNPVIFLFSDGEEPGMLGAEAFVAGHPWAAEVDAVVNLEARGSSGQSILFETTENAGWLTRAFVQQARQPIVGSVYNEVYDLAANNTDLTIYEAAGMHGINLGFIEEFAHYHTPLDNLTNLNPGSVQHQGDNALAAVRAYSELDLSQPPPGNRISLDLAPGLIVHWPEPWSLVLGAGALLLWAGLTVFLLRRRQLSLRALLWSLPLLPLGVIVAAALGFGLLVLISNFVGSAAPLYAHPWPGRIALWASAFFVQVLLSLLFARRAGFWGLALGVWFWWALFALLLAPFAPGFGALFLIPAVPALLAFGVYALLRLRTTPRAEEIASGGIIAASIGVFGAASLWLPTALYSETGAGVELGGIAGFSVALATTTLAPLLALPERRRRLRHALWAVAALLAVIATVIAANTASFSELRPQRLNLMHYEARPEGEASWLLATGSLPGGAAAMPEPLLQAAEFGNAAPSIAFPWSDEQYLAAPAPATTEPAPNLQLVDDEQSNGERLLHLQLSSPRGAGHVALIIPEAAGLRRIAVPDAATTLEALPARNGFHTFDCFGARCDGLSLTLHLQSSGPITFFIYDDTWGLPPSGTALLQARPATAAPSQMGDVTRILNEVVVGE